MPYFYCTFPIFIVTYHTKQPVQITWNLQLEMETFKWKFWPKGRVKKKKKVGFWPTRPDPPPSHRVGTQILNFFLPIFFILMDSIHFKTDFSMKKKCFFCLHFLQSPTIYSLKTVQNLLSCEAFNDGMYSTNMVYFDCSPGIQQPRCHIHCL